MAYVNAAQMLQKARQGGYAVGQFNINNLESIRVFLQAAQEAGAPLMIGVSGGIAKALGGYRTIADTVRNMMDYYRITVPVCLHADHSSYEGAVAALESGFSSVMYDGSRLPFEENLARTAELLERCHARGVSLEAEVGPVSGKEDGGAAEALGELADPAQCAAVAALGVDMLAASIGNVHGAYPADWQGLNFPLLEEIRRSVNGTPLVLHGGSGIPEEMVRQAIAQGVCKINVNSECREAFAARTQDFVRSGEYRKDPGCTQLVTLQPGLEGVREVCLDKMRRFGCAGRA